jgi:hypothetical protein
MNHCTPPPKDGPNCGGVASLEWVTLARATLHGPMVARPPTNRFLARSEHRRVVEVARADPPEDCVPPPHAVESSLHPRTDERFVHSTPGSTRASDESATRMIGASEG